MTAHFIMGIEKIPQMFPAEDSWLGVDHFHPDVEWFVRMKAPNHDADTMLMSNISFHEIAKEVGYVRKTDVMSDLESLREQVNNAVHVLSVTTTSFHELRSAVSATQSIDDTLSRLEQSLATVQQTLRRDRSNAGQHERASQNSEVDERHTDSAAGSDSVEGPADASTGSGASSGAGKREGSSDSGSDGIDRESSDSSNGSDESSAKPVVAAVRNGKSSGQGSSKK